MDLRRRFALLAWLSLAAACVRTRTLPISPSQLPLALHLQEHAAVAIPNGNQMVTVTRAADPHLEAHVNRRCSLWKRFRSPRDCAPVVSAPIDHVSVENDTLRKRVATGTLLWGGHTTLELPLREAGNLRLRYDALDQRSSLGLGFVVAGPSRLAGPQFQWLPARWVALELGLFGAPDLGVLGWTGTRLRPFSLGRFTPFVGAFANGAAFSGHGQRDRQTTLGPRAGLDIDALSGHLLITAEFDIAFPMNPSDEFFDGRTGTWHPWGGASVSYLY